MAGTPSKFISTQSNLNDEHQTSIWQEKVAKAVNELLRYNIVGTGIPTINAPNGAVYHRTDGGLGTSLYVREAGTWVSK